MSDYHKVVEKLEQSAAIIRLLDKYHDKYVKRVIELRRILDLCPGGLPDGTGIMGPEQWIKWARKKLGYSSDKA